MRQRLIIGNWKMNGCLTQNSALLSQLLNETSKMEHVDVVVCPPFTYLSQVSQQLSSSKIKIGAQNVCAAKAGAYTGEISTTMLTDLECSYVLVGHSERRSILLEDNEQVAAKFKAALDAGLIPVLCVGETLAQYEAGATQAVVSSQIQVIIDRVGAARFADAVIAYEPVWAIGTGKTATPEQAQQVHAQIRAQLAKHSPDIANGLQILYGGSVNANNAHDLLSQNDIDGGLIGGASLKADAFLQICQVS
ncbi:MAG: triose-phosphate isomerase [Gammaproteobacteria bacterium]|nr:triose-phosphate isomerase [Gammaproteobacteria bacterium]